MKKEDAIKILGLNGELNPAIIKKAFRSLSKKFHPDINPAGNQMQIALNEAYAVLKDFSGTLENKELNYGEDLNQALNSIIHCVGLNIEICGAWVWVSGNSKPFKANLKEAGFRWASKKKKWYFRPSDWKSKGRGKMSMDNIRLKYGSKEVHISYIPALEA